SRSAPVIGARPDFLLASAGSAGLRSLRNPSNPLRGASAGDSVFEERNPLKSSAIFIPLCYSVPPLVRLSIKLVSIFGVPPLFDASDRPPPSCSRRLSYRRE